MVVGDGVSLPTSMLIGSCCTPQNKIIEQRLDDTRPRCRKWPWRCDPEFLRRCIPSWPLGACSVKDCMAPSWPSHLTGSCNGSRGLVIALRPDGLCFFEQPVTRKTSQGSRSLVPPVVFSIRRCGTRASGERKPSLPSRQFEILGHTRRNKL